MKNKGLMNAKSLACYIMDYYSIRFNEEISPIKLQKALYFCFAYWGGFIKNSNNYSSEIKEESFNYSEYLFDASIEAWVYGPVIPDVYHENDLDLYRDPNLFKDKPEVKEYLNNVLDDILGLNDFKLVDISHEDKCWSDHFKIDEDMHTEEIPKEEIVEEYESNC